MMRRLVLVLLALGSCVTTSLPRIDEDAVERARETFPDITAERLESGRRTFSRRCGACHEPFHPSTRTRAGWEHAVAEMSPRAGLDPERQKLVLEYLITFSR